MKEELLIVFGERVKAARKARGMSMQQLADKLGYNSRSSILRIENGTQEIPLPKIQELARVLNVAPEYLMSWENATGYHEAFVEIYEKLDSEDRKELDRYAKYLLSSEKYKGMKKPRS